jgi:hypothetical protein
MDTASFAVDPTWSQISLSIGKGQCVSNQKFRAKTVCNAHMHSLAHGLKRYSSLHRVIKNINAHMHLTTHMVRNVLAPAQKALTQAVDCQASLVHMKCLQNIWRHTKMPLSLGQWPW